jgi:hypothetical protein
MRYTRKVTPVDEYVEAWLKIFEREAGNSNNMKQAINKLYIEGFEDGFNEGRSEQ